MKDEKKQTIIFSGWLDMVNTIFLVDKKINTLRLSNLKIIKISGLIFIPFPDFYFN